MYRFLAAPRWIAGLLATLLLAGVMVRLGMWQLDRLFEKRSANTAIAQARAADPRPASELIPSASDRKPASSAQWAKVSVTGTYDAAQTILIRQRTFEDGVGFEVVVPFVADDGVTYLVDRGYVLASANANQAPTVPTPPQGVVTVTGSVKVPYSNDSDATRVDKVGEYNSVRALNPRVLSTALGLPLAGGYIAVTDESPSAAASIERIPTPKLDEGPHLSYAVQWWLFALLTLVGVGYMTRREAIIRLLAEEDYDDDLVDEPDADDAGVRATV